MTWSQNRPANLLSIPTPRGRLDGAFYPARDGDGVTAMFHIHGKGGNFYSGLSRSLPHADRDQRFAHLALNMSSHDLGYTRYDRPMVSPETFEVAGGMWEHIGSGHEDVSVGIAWLEHRGFERIVLVGHSSGGFYAAQYAVNPSSSLIAQVLISPVISHRSHFIPRWFADEAALRDAITLAEETVRDGQGQTLISVNGWYHAISADSLLERAREPDDALHEHLRASTTPLLMIVGEREPQVDQWRAALGHSSACRTAWHVVEEADHAFLDQHQEIADVITGFIDVEPPSGGRA